MKKWLWLIMTSFLLIGIVTGCGNANEAPIDEDEKTVETETGDEENNDSLYPITVTDATGEEITLESQPKSIISLVPSNTEIIYSLGMLDHVVAVTDNDDFPEGIQDSKESVGGMEFDIEKILSLKPDLVLANKLNAEEGLNQMRNAGITVVVVGSDQSFEDVYQSIELIAKVTGSLNRGEEIVTNMKERIEEIKEKAAQISIDDQVTVWVEIWSPELYTTGKGSFMHEMLGFINAENAAKEQEGWPMFTEEDAVKTNPDVIITTYGHVEGKESAVEDVLARPAWQEVSAVKNKRVYNIQANIVERPGPRLIEGVEKLAETVYPEIFAQ